MLLLKRSIIFKKERRMECSVQMNNYKLRKKNMITMKIISHVSRTDHSMMNEPQEIQASDWMSTFRRN